MQPNKLKKILVAVDFSKASLNALDTALSVVNHEQAEFTLIHVIENTSVMLPPEAGGFAGTFLSELLNSGNEALLALEKKIRTSHNAIRLSQAVQSGIPADEICRMAAQEKSDLIVLGTHGVSGLREFFLGSTAYRVVKNAPCPVMTIPETNGWKNFRKILFPIRMIPNALDKYDVVRPIIRKNGSSVLIIGIVDKSDSSTLIEMDALTEFVRMKMEEDDVICGCEVHYTENIAQHLLDISNVEKPDLIVITATLDEPNQDFFFGAYTQSIVNHSRFPVLSVRPEVSGESVGSLSKSIVEAFDGLYQN